jgi:putative endonuclease
VVLCIKHSEHTITTCIFLLIRIERCYILETNNLKERLYYHRNPEPFSKAFTTRYKCFYLLYYEHFQDVDKAIDRETQLKKWRREKKEVLINSFNPEWRFLNDEI